MLILSSITNRVLGIKNSYRLKYYHQRGHFPNLKHPKDLSEYLISKMFTQEFADQKADCADKIKVREYLEKKGYGHLLLKHYGVWDRPEDINWESLPQKFILKANNGCGDHVICTDKDKLDKEVAIAKLNRSLWKGLHRTESHYRAIKPKVFAEQLIETGNGEWPTDYKFTCIKGRICDCFIAVERKTNTKYITFDTNWNPLNTTKPEYLPKNIPPRPKHLEEMLEIAQTLSKDFDVVRVDLYEWNDHVFFSELTFTPWGGLLYSYTNEAILNMGKLLL